MTDTAAGRPDLATPTPTSSSAWLAVMSRLYDPFVWLGEVAGMRRRRRALLAGAHGRVVEIGAGTGLNVRHYPEGLDDLVLTEPEPGMRRKLAHAVARRALAARILDAPAERLPVADASVDTVVSTLVLCTVDDPESALREIARILRPGGRLLFVEHVRARSRWLATAQDALLRPWRGFAGGCVCNRPTVELMRACGFRVDADEQVWRGMPAIVHPLVVGSAWVDS
ncbi:class I SAM-dependent methyltransferase [Mycobacterium sp. shizuoka-1]|uniref:class I SAM-dependent methyltransferase n=1 Tax=Mycobacterium sp. shizuoka-1 TaxID=2039281 RepID=UPI000C065177|nr:class I SAM-dependent methyltransferase [Mycobacterium sp. shizuoka-1]GAY16866.1 type 11 methyltransferase [Mycobacterium sp. shizuoka-1]